MSPTISGYEISTGNIVRSTTPRMYCHSPDGADLPDGRVLLGQLVISRDMARVQAEKAGHSELRELEELTLHGVLHILGYDHSVDQGEMDELELEMRQDVLA